MIDQDALSAEKRAQILQGAAAVFAQDGYEGASMSAIARQAGVSKGTLYNHFGGKADLFVAHMRQACATYISQIFEHLDDDDDLEGSLAEIGRRMCLMILTPERRSIFRMVIAEAESFPDLANGFYQAGPQKAAAILSRWIAVQVSRGRLVAADTDFAAEQFLALAQAELWLSYRLHLSEPPTEAQVDRVVAGAVRMFLACYGVPA